MKLLNVLSPAFPGVPVAGGLHRGGGWRALGLPLVMALAALQAEPARADMWRFVDAQGVEHFSSAQLDKRYQLLFRSSAETLSASAARAADSDAGPVSGFKTPSKLTHFDRSSSYKAVKHLLREASDTHGIDYELLQALIATESGFNTLAVSPKGAVGLMQLIPPTAARYGVKSDKDSPVEKKLTDPKTNIQAGSRYLSYLIKLFPGQIELAIAAYNAGEGAVQRAGNKIPNYPETINYVKNVMQLYNRLKPASAEYGSSASSVSSGSSGRVRVEMMGGARSRRNMVPPIVASTRGPESAGGLD